MRLVSWLVWVLALVVVAIAGCNEVTVPTAPFTVHVTIAVPGEPRAAGEGAQLCETDTTNCKLTGANGEVTIELPIGEEASVSLEKDEYASYLLSVVMTANGYTSTFNMARDEYYAGEHERLNAPYPMRGTGTIRILLSPSTAPLPGVTFELVGATGNAYYDDEEGRWDRELTATTSFNRGGFVEVTPGEFQVKVGGAAGNCGIDLAWPDDDEDTFRMRVREGFIGYVVLRCPLPPP